MDEPRVDRSDMWKALKWAAILLVVLLTAFGIFKAWQVATAPARAVTGAADSVKASTSAILNRLDVPIRNQRRFDRTADAAFARLNVLPESTPKGMKDRGFRMTNLRGSQNRICELTHDFGTGAVPVFVSADNAAHEAAKRVGANSDRLIRIVVVSPEETLGLNAEYDDEARRWTLGWRTSSVNKPYPDSWAEKPLSAILRSVPSACPLSP